MTSFIGSRKDFKRFFGPFLRNLVQSHTRSHKKSIGKCQRCDDTENLEAAHIHGLDRDQLIDSLLEGLSDKDPIEVNLDAFAELFKQKHNPVSKTIIVLCKKCHWQYDNKERVRPTTPLAKVDDSSELLLRGLQISNLSKQVLATESITISEINSDDFSGGNGNPIAAPNVATVEELKKKLERWGHRKDSIVFKAIQLVLTAENGRIKRNRLVEDIEAEAAIETNNAYQIVASLLTDRGKAYGRVFNNEDGIISIRSDLKSTVEENWPTRPQ